MGVYLWEGARETKEIKMREYGLHIQNTTMKPLAIALSGEGRG
jgi:hypothetical protein